MPTANTDPEFSSLKQVEPYRPDLRPGQSVTAVPDLWCLTCEKPRGGTTCGICGGVTCSPPLEEAQRVHTKYQPTSSNGGSTMERQTPGSADGPSAAPAARDVASESTIRARLPWLGGASKREPSESRAAVEPSRSESAEDVPTVSERPRPLRVGSDINTNEQHSRGSIMRDSRDAAGRRNDDVDERGRPIHRVGGKRQVQQHVDQAYIQHWTDDCKVRKDLWVSLLGSAMVGKTVEEVPIAAKMADAAYIELMLRENGRWDEI